MAFGVTLLAVFGLVRLVGFGTGANASGFPTKNPLDISGVKAVEGNEGRTILIVGGCGGSIGSSSDGLSPEALSFLSSSVCSSLI